MVPVVGTAGSILIDGALAVRDISKAMMKGPTDDQIQRYTTRARKEKVSQLADQYEQEHIKEQQPYLMRRNLFNENINSFKQKNTNIKDTVTARIKAGRELINDKNTDISQSDIILNMTEEQRQQFQQNMEQTIQNKQSQIRNLYDQIPSIKDTSYSDGLKWLAKRNPDFWTVTITDAAENSEVVDLATAIEKFPLLSLRSKKWVTDYIRDVVDLMQYHKEEFGGSDEATQEQNMLKFQSFLANKNQKMQEVLDNKEETIDLKEESSTFKQITDKQKRIQAKKTQKQLQAEKNSILPNSNMKQIKTSTWNTTESMMKNMVSQPQKSQSQTIVGPVVSQPIKEINDNSEQIKLLSNINNGISNLIEKPTVSIVGGKTTVSNPGLK